MNFVNDQTGIEDARWWFETCVKKGNWDVKVIGGKISVIEPFNSTHVSMKRVMAINGPSYLDWISHQILLKKGKKKVKHPILCSCGPYNYVLGIIRKKDFILKNKKWC